MNKEDILEKSRKENKNKDLYEKEVTQLAGNIAVVVAVIIATLFYVIQMIVGASQNHGLYAVVLSV